MALNRSNRYPGRFAATSLAHPQGAFKNRTSATSKDGSYLEADWLNDMSALQEAILAQAGVVPNGNVDSATSSQVFTALQSLFPTTGRLLGPPQIFTVSGTYTPTSGAKTAVIEIIGAGGGGGGTGTTSTNTSAVGSGGNSGAAAKKRITNPVTTAITVGIGGAGGVGDNPGSGGGVSAFGSLISAPGGKGGLKVTLTSNTAVVSACAAATEVATGGDINFKSGQGNYGTVSIVGSGWSGKGGDSIFGSGAGGVNKSDGVAATNPGSGGSGSHDDAGGPARVGGKGANGICIIWEYA